MTSPSSTGTPDPRSKVVLDSSAGDILEPAEPGTSAQYIRGRALRRYGLWYTLALVAFTAIWGATAGVLLPNQVQMLEMARFFSGADTGVDLQQLTVLRDAIAAGTATATADESRLLGILSAFDASRAQSLALVSSIGVAGTMIVQPLIGVLSDRTRSRLGRRAPWMILGVVVGAAFLIGVRFAPTVAVLVVLWTVAQVTLNAALAPLSASLADRIPESRRGTISGFGGLGNFVGGILGSVAAGAAFAMAGLDTYFFFAGLVVVAVLLFVLRVPDRSSTSLVVTKLDWKSFLLGFTYALRSRDYRWVWIARILLTFGYGVSGALGFYMLQSYVTPALSQAEATALVPLLALAGLPSTVLAIVIAGALSDRLRRRKSFVLAASLLMAASMAIPLLSPTVPGLFIQAIVAGFAFGIYSPVDQALFIDVLPDAQAAGRDLGVAGLATNAGQALGPALAGTVVAVTGGYAFVWVSAIVLVGLAAVAIIPVRRR